MAVTHDVFNQPAPLADINLFDTNRALQDALRFNAPDTESAVRMLNGLSAMSSMLR